MSADKFEMFRNRLTKVYKHVGKQARRQGITCYRVYDHDLPEFPFCIEIYEENIYLAEYKRRHSLTEEEHEQWLEDCIQVISEILELPSDNVYIKQRQRKAGRLGQYQRVATEEAFFEAKEAGLTFKVNLSDYLDTGLFLDHRITRGMVREGCAGKRVLNLFCYTASFSVYAAAGGATSVTSVDLSKTYLKWGEDNMELNKLYDPQKHYYVHADVKQYLDTLKPGAFDLVIMDPPTFSNSKRMLDFLDIQRDHVELINKTLRAMSEGGVLYFSTNYRKFILDAEQIQSTSIKDITKATTPFDFQGKLHRQCFKIVKG
ncbi:class I SAM-dependent methyltransferase [Paraflavitalea sp. CAU 1676]|uniref:class I SAM-dependent methyltransferase n=1 Tax=Paraflavitalea sp. CAU 1676 TaxID=3032598 RepID=UPI0023DA1C20|nr:class I SAM-dependent methyltransferase [Paraflavitalea sp. CAU 1676]MDF2189988.1 class I SAM-dependent methyltransferase [Paraflavitalea sp. CAU 1676]